MFTDDSNYIKSVFKIGSIERLLLEMKTKFKMYWSQQNVRFNVTINDILETDIYGSGLACNVNGFIDISNI